MKIEVGTKVIGTEAAFPHRVGTEGVVDRIDNNGIVWVDWGDSVQSTRPHEIKCAPSCTLTIQAGKYYRTRDGRKVGPMEETDNGDPGGFRVDILGLYRKDGTFGFGSACYCRELDIIAEWVDEQTGMLAELDVKPGDVVTPMLQCASDDASLTIGNAYEIMIDPNDGDASFIDDDGDWCDLTGSSIFRIISRASDAPKTWGEMTDAEKMPLLLDWNDNSAKNVQQWNGSEWVRMQTGRFGRANKYRIKPEPVRETVVMEGACFSDVWRMSQTGFIGEHTHRITFTTTDGKPDLDSIKMEEV